MTQGGPSRADTFRSFASALLSEGNSANFIIATASDLGLGMRRSEALGIIRDLRTASESAVPPAFQPTIEGVTPAGPEFRWGDAIQETDQWARFDGPVSTMFQQLGPNADQWLEYVVLPEDTEANGFRLVIADDEYISDDGRNPGYRTTKTFDMSISPGEASRRLGIQQSDVVRIIFDK